MKYEQFEYHKSVFRRPLQEISSLVNCCVMRNKSPIFSVLLTLLSFLGQGATSAVETRLFEDLMYNYNKVARPVRNSTDLLTITFSASLIRIIDIDEKNQVFTTNLWLGMQWTDSKLVWEPGLYGNLTKIHIPAELICAAGDPEITIYNDAVVHADGLVIWSPPAIYKSFCSIDVTWFPYDSQKCEMKFGLWTYTGSYVDMRQSESGKVKLRLAETGGVEEMFDIGMDLSYFYESAEWDLLALTSARHEKIYPGCCGPEKYVDITYYFRLRRKTLFFTVNLIIPCFLISFLTTFVFYLSDHKITFAISILVTLTVFFLVLIDVIPPTSTVIPMCARYLLFTMILVTLSIVISVVSVNFHFRRGSTHTMPLWMRKIFLDIFPRWLRMKKPRVDVVLDQQSDDVEEDSFTDPPDHRRTVPTAPYLAKTESWKWSESGPNNGENIESSASSIDYGIVEKSSRGKGEVAAGHGSIHPDDFELQRNLHTRVINQLLSHIQLIADHFCAVDDDEQEASDWRYVAMVIDRLFLILYSFFNVGTLFIILRAPTLYDMDQPLAIPEASKPLGQDTIGSLYPRIMIMANRTSV